MNADVRALYRDVIIDHSKQPRNFRRLDGAARSAEAYNPLCGDRLTVYVEVAGEVLRDVSFEGSACGISRAAASLMTETIKGRSRAEVAMLHEALRALVGQGPQASIDFGLGALAVFSGVHEFPSRMKCVLLPWQALETALNCGGEIALCSPSALHVPPGHEQ